jgi:6-phosphogluconolactonase (cycloisomerase 2 family)
LRLFLAILFFALPVTAGVLDLLAVYHDGKEVPDGLGGASAVAVSPDGRHVYATGGEDDALVAWRRSAPGAPLTLLQALFDQHGGVFGLDGASSVVVSPDGRHVYTTGRIDDALAVFRRDVTHDALSFIETQEEGVGGVFGLDGASSVAVSLDGRHVYATGAGDDALVVFRRDVSRDQLAYVETQENGAGGIWGLGGASAVTVSPDGRHVYAAGGRDATVTVFRRDSTRDGLTFVGALKSDAAFAGASSLAPSPDGAHLYLAGSDADALTALRRTPAGGLALVEIEVDGAGGVEGMKRPSAVAVSPDGRWVFAAAAGGQAVVVFRRDAVTGGLDFVQTVRDGDGRTSGLAGASAVAPSPDGTELYAAGREEGTLVAFLLRTQPSATELDGDEPNPPPGSGSGGRGDKEPPAGGSERKPEP